ncbi:MAG: AmmeMemoRadiSam system radical SAM enzyme, partial [Spirochaetia bacterium]|nr:AmmeMemoRadiSam system radical SAM enzyme [Spirochaetia bacterium]
MKEALLYDKLTNLKVQCNLCRLQCKIGDGKRGSCGVRENINGILYSLSFDRVIAANVDPIEKKPLFNFYPGTFSYSISTMGCNFRCLHCQNSDISQPPRYSRKSSFPGEKMTPEQIVREAKSKNCLSISYTYTEPTIFFELAYATSRLAKESGLKNVFVSNGYMSREALDMMQGSLDAINVDLKSFRDSHYRKVCGARLAGVLDSLKYIKKLGIWLEVTTLIIPGYNDSAEEFSDIANFIKNELGEETPWHVTAFFPTYKLMDAGRTPSETLRQAREI